MKYLIAMMCAAALVGCKESPEQAERSGARRTIDGCKEQFSRAKDRADGTQGFVAKTCQKMEDDFYAKYKAKP